MLLYCNNLLKLWFYDDHVLAGGLGWRSRSEESLSALASKHGMDYSGTLIHLTVKHNNSPVVIN